MSHDKKFGKISRGFLLFSTGMLLATGYNAYHTLKESDKFSLAQELGEEDTLTFSVFRENKSDNIVLSIISFNPDFDYKLSDEDYEKLDQLLHNEFYPISKLNLTDLGDEIDFSRVDLSGVSDICFQGVYDNFDYVPFSDNVFHFISFLMFQQMKV